MVWPTAEQVTEAARDWAQRLAEHEPAVLAIGYFGSYARGDWGVGSDLDLVVVLREAESPRNAAVADPDPASLPVPAEVRIYGEREWRALLRSDRRMGKVFLGETVWLVGEAAVAASRA